MVLLLLAFASCLDAPAPSATPLEEIGRVRASALCTTLRENVRPALAGVVANDAALSEGRGQLEKMAQDAVRRSRASLPFERSAVDNAVRRIVAAAAAAQTALADPLRFPAEPKTEDERRLAELKQRLLAAMHAQNDALNVLNGTVETDRMGEMQKEGLDTLQSALGNDRAPAAAQSLSPSDEAELTSYLGVAGLPQEPATGLDAVKVWLSNGLIGNTVYDRMAGVTAVEQARGEQETQAAERALVDLWRGCAQPPGH